MIKANELRIGNLVYDNLGGILKIKAISLESGLSHIEPIPLTEEWLLKFGFETSERLWDSFSRSNYYLSKKDLSKKDELCFMLHESKDVFYMCKYRHIKYVHQLQNLYFALTGEELTIKDLENER